MKGYHQAAGPLMHSTQVHFPSSTTKSYEIKKQIWPVANGLRRRNKYGNPLTLIKERK